MQLKHELTPQERVQALIAQAAATVAPDQQVHAPEPEPEPQSSEAIVKRPISLIEMAQANHANLMELGRMVQAQSQVLEAVAQAVGEIHAALYQTQYVQETTNPQQFDSEF